MTSLAVSVSIPPPAPYSAWHELPLAHRDAAGVVILELPKKLDTPNRVLWAHWSLKRRERQAWGRLVWGALVRGGPGLTRTALEAAGLAPACEIRMHVAIARYVRSAREFIRDDDNLTFAGKPLVDALVESKLLLDDRREWLDRSPITQHVAPDGRARTVVTLRPAEVRP